MHRGSRKKVASSSPVQPEVEDGDKDGLQHAFETQASLIINAPDTVVTSTGAPLGPWTSPRLIFVLISSLFWSTSLITYVQYRLHLGGGVMDLRAVPCNPSNRLLATCAHRGNAAELLSVKGSKLSLGDGDGQPPSLQDQITALWSHGITCFDFDVIQLAGGEMIVGHPADIIQLSRKGSSSKEGLALTAGLLHQHKLSELRAAGVGAEAAPLLHTVMRHFAQLRRSKPLPSYSSRGTGINTSSDAREMSVMEAAAARHSWQQVPVLSLELKGPAASSLEAWQEVLTTAKSAAVADATIIWLRRQAGSSDGSAEQQPLLKLAKALRDAGSSTNSLFGGAAGSSSNSSRPLIGLIVPDSLPHQQTAMAGVSGSSSKAAAANSSQAAAAAAAVLRAAAGLGQSSGSENGIGSSSSSVPDAAVVLDAFDALAPSIKLPPGVLASFVDWKPIFAWTLGTAEEYVHKSMWLGLDVAINDQPLQQQVHVQQKGTDSVCPSGALQG